MPPKIIDKFRDEYFFLSNMSLAQITYKGIIFKTSEHFYQACKTYDKAQQLKIIQCNKPSEAKKLDRSNEIDIRADWDDVKLNIMKTTLLLKFTQNIRIQRQLLATGDATLIEGNHWHDNFFGNCTCNKPKCAEFGQNNLGKLLMELRSYLRTI